MTAVETITRGGFTAKLYCDEDCTNPREDDEGKFLFLGFPHRHYDIGDETLDPGQAHFSCPECGGGLTITEGDGDYEGAGSHEIGCPRCDGCGEVCARNMAELIEFVQRKYDARMVKPVGMIDHSGVSYYLGGGPHWSDSAGWDSGTCGLMVATHENLVEKWAAERTDEEIEGWMRAELEEYSSWANGDCYGYRIEDLNGDEVDGCWGLIGHEYAMSELEAALSAVIEHCPQPEQLYEVPRMTEAQIRALIDACALDFMHAEDHPRSTALVALSAVIVEIEEGE